MCVFISFRNCLNYNRFRVLRFRVLHAVDSLNVKHKLQSKRVLSCFVSRRLLKMIFLGLPVENRVLLFAWMKANE